THRLNLEVLEDRYMHAVPEPPEEPVPALFTWTGAAGNGLSGFFRDFPAALRAPRRTRRTRPPPRISRRNSCCACCALPIHICDHGLRQVPWTPCWYGVGMDVRVAQGPGHLSSLGPVWPALGARAHSGDP